MGRHELRFQPTHYPLYDKFVDETENIYKILKTTYFVNILYYTTLYGIKAAFVVYYYELVPDGMRKTKLSLHATGLYTAVTYICSMEIHFFWCFPISRNW